MRPGGWAPAPRRDRIARRDVSIRSSRQEVDMNRLIDLRAGVLALALAAAGLLLVPAPGFSQTQGMERRQTRRERRDDARETRQKGRHESRDAKQACRDAG